MKLGTCWPCSCWFYSIWLLGDKINMHAMVLCIFFSLRLQMKIFLTHIYVLHEHQTKRNKNYENNLQLQRTPTHTAIHVLVSELFMHAMLYLHTITIDVSYFHSAFFSSSLVIYSLLFQNRLAQKRKGKSKSDWNDKQSEREPNITTTTTTKYQQQQIY